MFSLLKGKKSSTPPTPSSTFTSTPFASACRQAEYSDRIYRKLNSNESLFDRFVTLAEAKSLYLQLKYDSSCLGEKEQIGMTLRPVWQRYISDKAQNNWLLCMSSCITDCSGLTSQCDREMSEMMERENQGLSNFLR